jgi:hypothetical protein
MITHKLAQNPLIWFFLLPLIVVGLCSLLLPLRYDSFYKILVAQYKLEQAIPLLESEIHALWKQPKTDEVQKKLEALYVRLENTRKELSKYKYKIEWGSSAADAVTVYFQNGMSSASQMSQPFVVLWVLGIFFQLFALARRNITPPFYMRLGFLSTGTLLGAFTLAQWVFATLYAPAWHSTLTGFVFIPLFTAWMVGCCVVFVKNFCTDHEEEK